MIHMESLPSINSILIVDDNKMVRKLLENLLNKLGHGTILCGGGQEGLDTYQKYYKINQKIISGIILDMEMPIMDGYKTLLEIQKINPNVRVLFNSGYSTDHGINNLLVPNQIDSLGKPFTIKDLEQKIKLFALP